MNAAEIAFAKIMLAERSDEGSFGVRLLERIEQAWRARQAERERHRVADAPHRYEPIDD